MSEASTFIQFLERWGISTGLALILGWALYKEFQKRLSALVKEKDTPQDLH